MDKDENELHGALMTKKTERRNLPSELGRHNLLKAKWLETPIGPMLGIADEEVLHLLEFVERRGLQQQIERLQQKTKATIVFGSTEVLRSIQEELNQYFDGGIWDFQTPLALHGSPFQRQVWNELQKIPAGGTRSYSDLAVASGRPSACRAVAQANGANQLAVVIPCHRVIHANGELGGYAGGVLRKRWLLAHEGVKA